MYLPLVDEVSSHKGTTLAYIDLTWRYDGLIFSLRDSWSKFVNLGPVAGGGSWMLVRPGMP